MKKLLDIGIKHFILRGLPRIFPKYIWGRISPVLFTVFMHYAKTLRPLIFGTPSERFIEYSWAIKNLQENDKRILDVGCGDSLFDCKLAGLGYGYEIYAIDLVSQCMNKKSNYHFLQADIVNAPFKDSSFDKIHALSTVEHIDEGKPGLSKDQITCMVNMCRILKRRGGLILTMPLGDYDGACNLHRFENLIRTAMENGLQLDAQLYHIAQGRKWEIISGDKDKAMEKIELLLNKKKIIVCLSFTKNLGLFKEGDNQ